MQSDVESRFSSSPEPGDVPAQAPGDDGPSWKRWPGGCWHPLPALGSKASDHSPALLSLNCQDSEQAGKVPGSAQILPGTFRVTVTHRRAKQRRDSSDPAPRRSEHHRGLTLLFPPVFPWLLLAAWPQPLPKALRNHSSRSAERRLCWQLPESLAQPEISSASSLAPPCDALSSKHRFPKGISTWAPPPPLATEQWIPLVRLMYLQR